MISDLSELHKLSIILNLLYNCGRIFFILSFFVGYILSFGLVRLRTVWLSARAGAHIDCRYSHLCAEDGTITNVIIKTPDRKLDWGCEWCHAWKQGAENFGDFWKKQLVEIWTWARSIELWSTCCAVHLLGQWDEILTLGWEFSWGVDWRAM